MGASLTPSKHPVCLLSHTQLSPPAHPPSHHPACPPTTPPAPTLTQDLKQPTAALTPLYSSAPFPQNLKLSKTIRYESRKQLALQRPRIKGQFVKAVKTEDNNNGGGGGGGADQDEAYPDGGCGSGTRAGNGQNFPSASRGAAAGGPGGGADEGRRRELCEVGACVLGGGGGRLEPWNI